MKFGYTQGMPLIDPLTFCLLRRVLHSYFVDQVNKHGIQVDRTLMLTLLVVIGLRLMPSSGIIAFPN